MTKSAAPRKLFDVLAINIGDSTVRFMDTGKTLENAEAIIKMAVMRRGVDEEFYAEVPAGSYVEGDKWRGRE